eukprot:3885079-Rhodomonas_salina.3
MSSTDKPYAATRPTLASPRPTTRISVVSAISLRARYAMSGTDLAYAATRRSWPELEALHVSHLCPDAYLHAYASTDEGVWRSSPSRSRRIGGRLKPLRTKRRGARVSEPSPVHLHQ